MFVHNFNPVLFSIGPLTVRYYGLFIVCAVLFIYWYLRLILVQKKKLWTQDELNDVVLWGVVGSFLGARIFYVLVYGLPFYVKDPIKVLYLWQGGLSFHGGLIFGVLSVFLFCKYKKKDFLIISDLITIPGAVGLAFGRIANFINGELVGHVTTLPWGVNFGGEVDSAGNLVYRHPSQLYASLKNVLIAGTLFILSSKGLPKGALTGMFFLMYSVLRFIVGFFRAPDYQLGFILFGLTMGQLLNILLFCFSLGFLYYVFTKRE